MLTKVFLIYTVYHAVNPIIIDMDSYNLIKDARMPICELLFKQLEVLVRPRVLIGTCIEFAE